MKCLRMTLRVQSGCPGERGLPRSPAVLDPSHQQLADGDLSARRHLARRHLDDEARQRDVGSLGAGTGVGRSDRPEDLPALARHRVLASVDDESPDPSLKRL